MPAVLDSFCIQNHRQQHIIQTPKPSNRVIDAAQKAISAIEGVMLGRKVIELKPSAFNFYLLKLFAGVCKNTNRPRVWSG